MRFKWKISHMFSIFDSSFKIENLPNDKEYINSTGFQLII